MPIIEAWLVNLLTGDDNESVFARNPRTPASRGPSFPGLLPQPTLDSPRPIRQRPAMKTAESSISTGPVPERTGTQFPIRNCTENISNVIGQHFFPNLDYRKSERIKETPRLAQTAPEYPWLSN